MSSSKWLAGILLVAVLSVQPALAQVTSGGWTVGGQLGQSYGIITQCARVGPGPVAGGCVTLRAASNVTGNPPFGSSSCVQFTSATTTLTVGPAMTSVTFSGTLNGFMQQQSLGGGPCLVSAYVKLDGMAVLDLNPLPPNATAPATPLTVSTFNSKALCLTPGTHAVEVALNTYAYNFSGNGAQATTSDFFNFVGGVQRGFTVCFAAGGPCFNDDCALPIPLALGINPLLPAGGHTFSNVGATTSVGYPAICVPVNSDVWFSFVAPTSGNYRFDTNPPFSFAPGTLADTVIAVYGACGPMAAIACDDDSGFGTLSSVTVALNQGTTYYIRVADFGAPPANQGTFYLTAVQVMGLTFTSPGGPGSLQVNITGGPTGIQNGTYFFAYSFSSWGFPEAPFFGIDLTMSQFVSEFTAGPPTVDMLDGAGNMTIGPLAGLPSGLTVCAVVLGFAGGGGPGIIAGASPPVIYTIP